VAAGTAQVVILGQVRAEVGRPQAGRLMVLAYARISALAVAASIAQQVQTN
jgi:hypothetical protein